MAPGRVSFENCCHDKMKGILFSNDPGYESDAGDEMEWNGDVDDAMEET